MITIKNLNRQKTAILRNAYKVSYKKPVNQIWSAGFSLPLNDPATKRIQQMHYAEIVDTDGEYIGLFRVMTRMTTLNSQGRYVQYDCSHVLSTLIDATIEGYRQTERGWTTRQVIEWILSFQEVKHWQLGRCDFSRQFEYSFENQNGIADALFSVTELFPEDYMWTFDTQSYPWTINLIQPETQPTCRIREGWNLQTLTVEENVNKTINRLSALGKGDGINNLNFKKINNGINYVEDLESQATYGLIKYIWKDERFTNEPSLLASAQAMLDKFKRPIVTWKVKAADLIKAIPSRSTVRIPKIDELRAGKVVQLWTTIFGVVNLRIVSESKSDMYGSPGDLELEIGYIGGDITTTIADLERKLEIAKLSSVGATNKDTVSFAENCDEDFPLTIRFYCEEELKRINKILLTYQTENYRAYSRATMGGGATVASTSAGGATVASTSAGGATVSSTTTESGGASVQSATSSANGSHTHVVGTINQGPPPSTEVTGILRTRGTGEIYVGIGNAASGTKITTEEAVDNHTHNVTLSYPAHRHDLSVSIPNHTHQVTIPDHTHEVTLPDHIHEIDYGIWEDTTKPTVVEVTIDGKVVTTLTGTSTDRTDIVEFLYADTDGEVTRGWHEIQIKPIGARARFVGQCTIYGFIGSTEGGEF